MAKRPRYGNNEERARHPEWRQRPWAEFAYNLARLRGLKGWSHEDVAERFITREGTGCDPSYISQLETGLKRVGNETRAKMIRIFQVPKSEFNELPDTDSKQMETSPAEDSKYELLAAILERLEILSALMRQDPRADLLPALDGLIALYGRKTSKRKEVFRITNSLKRKKTATFRDETKISQKRFTGGKIKKHTHTKDYLQR